MKNYKQVLEDVGAVASQFADAQAAAYRRDPNLSPEGQGRVTAEKIGQAERAYGLKFDAAVERARSERDQSIARAARARPPLDLTDPATLVRTEQAWSHNVRPALERGRSLPEALAKAGPDDVLGAERFAPSWLTTNGARDSDVDQQHVVGQAVAQAFARLAATPEDADAIVAGEAADREFQVLQQVVGHHGAGRALEAALALQYADLPQTSSLKASVEVGGAA